MAWLIRLVLGPDQFPWRVNVVGLAVDVIVWGFVVFVFLVFFDRTGR